MKIGLFGGTFDPIHNAHVAVADAAIEAVRLDLVLLIPNGQSPFKNGYSDYHHRYAMCALACQGREDLQVSDLDFYTAKPSYTIYTLQKARERYPNDQLFFICGMDAYSTMYSWHDSHLFGNYCEFLVATRPHYEPPSGVYYDLLKSTTRFIDQLWLDVSSTDIRNSVVEEQPIINMILNPSVLEYINQQGLYQDAF